MYIFDCEAAGSASPGLKKMSFLAFIEEDMGAELAADFIQQQLFETGDREVDSSPKRSGVGMASTSQRLARAMKRGGEGLRSISSDSEEPEEQSSAETKGPSAKKRKAERAVKAVSKQAVPKLQYERRLHAEHVFCAPPSAAARANHVVCTFSIPRATEGASNNLNAGNWMHHAW